MSSTTAAAASTRGRQRAGSRPAPARAQARMGTIFSSGYTIFLLAFGVGPAVYALFLAFTKNGAFVGFDNFVRVFADYRFLPAVGHVALFVVVWLACLIVFVVLLALIVHAIRIRWLSTTSRFLFYIPGALAGASSVLLWLFVLDPAVSPVSFILEAFGKESFVQVVQTDTLHIVLAIIAFWTGAGGWIVIMYGALNNISDEVMEAARIDGAGPINTAWHIQIPLLRKWISYMAILSLAAGTQLFVEPRVLAQASKGVVTQDYSLNQLAFLYAFRQNDFNGSAAISLVLLVVALGLSVFFVFRGGLFERE
ncbi:carbohydrate ABC transporter permease [uncultured Schumannella sp.]|uniref:carbohydrate ABC transporter permease n=1 Tax=uncultured Schumannella sp. TaxID=1195956 RepID=UPI0025D8D2A4|nr:sugar ABC transporter permease [uncultured Schumannella sp.]